MGYGFPVSAKLIGISYGVYYASESWNSHKIFVRGRRHMEKHCKIINIFLIMVCDSIPLLGPNLEALLGVMLIR